MKAQEVINNTEEEKELAQSQIRQVANWFHNNSGELIPKQEAISKLKNDLDIDVPEHLTEEGFYSQLIGDLVGDHVDPVQMVNNGKGKYVGVIEYNEHDTYYTYEEYHDIEGQYTRGVCAACIYESSKSSEPFTRHTGKFGNEPYDDKEQLKEEIEIHVDAVHSGDSVEVKTGATLASGTTIAGNTSVHLGNESFLDESGDTATGTVTFEGSPSISASNNVQVETGQSIEDGSGTERMLINSTFTSVSDDSGNQRLVADDGVGSSLQFYQGDNGRMVYDRDGDFDAVQYNTSTSAPGTLELTDAFLSINPSGSTGVELGPNNSTNSKGFKFSNGNGNNVFAFNEAGSFSIDSNLRLATGQSIEDGSGQKRLEFGEFETNIYNDSEQQVIELNDNNASKIIARSNQPVQISDSEQGSIAVTYQTDASTGTLELSNANLSLNGNQIDGGDVVNSGSGAYEIQKNGSDTNGVINFKT